MKTRTVANYLTLSNTTSPEIVRQLQEAYQKLRDNGTIELIK